MITLTYFKDKQGKSYAMHFKGTFAQTVAKVHEEVFKGNGFIKTMSLNPDTGYEREITAQVRSLLARKQGRLH
jgi:hypothetical protein